MPQLNQQLKKHAAELLDRGYVNAADAFSRMINQKVSIKPVHLEMVEQAPKLRGIGPGNSGQTLLTTSIMGELSGKSYLILDNQEVEYICQSCGITPVDALRFPGEAEELLKELDNILSATMITEFSNYMSARIYGDVPGIYRLPGSKIKEKIVSDFNENRPENDYFLVADSEFIIENNSKIRPRFLWKLGQLFVDNFWIIKENQTI